MATGCNDTEECVCPSCSAVRKNERQKIAKFLREQADQFMPTKPNNEKMRKACAVNLADTVEEG